MSILNKKQMSEEDIKLQYITPTITSKWDVAKITMETKLTDGKINLKGNYVVREKPKRADYVLYLAPNNPINNYKGVGVKHINVADVCNLPVPVPPLDEQRRIVAKLKEILPLCERLK